jgi:hypothetical protein
MSMKALMDRVSWLHRALAIVLATAMLAACGGGSEEDDAPSVDDKASTATPRLEAPGEDIDAADLDGDVEGEVAEAAAGAGALAELPNGGSIAGSIGVGQTATHTFSARTGEGVQLRLADTSANAFVPRIDVFGPNGDQVTATWANDSANLAFAAPASGAYSVVVSDLSGTNAGNYELHYVRAPGAKEGGRLRNGGTVTSTLTVGDLDSYTFRARTGEGIQLRLTDINATGMVPRIFVYAPNGALVTNTWANNVAALAFAAPTSGTYTVVATDLNGTVGGTYELRYVRAPGAKEEGALVNGGSRSETLTVGDIDSYTFTAQIGEGVALHLVDVDATGMVPRIFVYGPTGALVTNTWNNDVAALFFAAPASGTYTVVVTDLNETGTGDYELHYARGTGANEHGPLIDDGVRTETITRGDMDSFVFTGNSGDIVQLRVTDVEGGAFVPRIFVYGPSGALITNTWANDVAILNLTLSIAGTYTVVVVDLNGTGTGPYTLGYTNSGQ